MTRRQNELIELRDIDVTFSQKKNDLHAVRNASLTIKDGEIFGIVGPSGAGKSTLVRVINLLQPPSHGTVLINGEDITRYRGDRLRKVRLRMGMIFQHFNLIMNATVYDNIAFALKANSYPKDRIQGRVEELLGQVNLSDKRDAYPAKLSGGQKQRIAIARALANEPEILLCDEATSALDLENTDEIIKILREINRVYGITIVFITHEMEVAKKLFDSMAIMSDGRIVETSDTYSIFTNPVHDVTKALVARVLDINLPEEVSGADHEDLLKITYVGANTNLPVISEVSKRFGVYVNILHGKIEYIQGKPVGVLLIKLKGEPGEVEKAKLYLEKEVYKVEPVNTKEKEMAKDGSNVTYLEDRITGSR